MRFAAGEDVEAPLEAVYAAVTDFPGFERALLRRGARIRRTEHGAGQGMGAGWEIEMPLGGTLRRIETRLAETYPPEGYRLTARSGGIEGWAVVELTALSPRRTRLEVVAELAPVTLAARLLVHSLKLAKPKIDDRLGAYLAGFARRLEVRRV